MDALKAAAILLALLVASALLDAYMEWAAMDLCNGPDVPALCR